MSVRQGARDCERPGCNTRVVTAQVTDSTWVWEIQLDDSVTAAPALQNGMGVGDFYGATVNHVENDCGVEHTITGAPLASETFAFGDNVRWSEATLARQGGRSLARRYGSGPFRVLGVKSASPEERHLALHNQMLTIALPGGSQADGLSGYHFTHA